MKTLEITDLLQAISMESKQYLQHIKGKQRILWYPYASKDVMDLLYMGPFYGSYVLFELDRENYQYAIVSGPDRSYLWILTRNPHPEKQLVDRLVKIAADKGFDTAKLIFVEQD